jgi:hypothetical protein
MTVRALSGCLAVTLCALCAHATDEVRERAFYDSVVAVYMHEYRECTGSMGSIDRAMLLEWKTKMDKLSQTQAYVELVREYRATVDSERKPLPCKVLAWNEERKKAQMQSESAMVQTLLAQDEANDARRDLDTLAKSPYDFGIFPFGVSKRLFLYTYKKTRNVEPAVMDSIAYVNDIQWGERPFLTAFHFDRNERLFKYEIESPALASDKLNAVVRPDAEYLSQVFTKKFGEPARRYTFGYFDIKSGVLSPYKTWDIKGYSVYVGISMENYRYYAKAVVARIPARPARTDDPAASK